MNDDQKYQRIESYLLGQMSKEDMLRFEADLINDNELNTMFKEQQKEHLLMDALVEKDLLKKIKSWENEKGEEDTSLSNTGNKIIPFYRRPMFIGLAASLVLLIGLMVWLNNNSQTEESKLVDEDKTEKPLKPKEDAPNQTEKELVVIPEEKPNKNVDQDTNNEQVVENSYKAPIKEKKESPFKQENSNDQANQFRQLAMSHTDPIDFSGIQVRGTKSALDSALVDLNENRIALGVEKLEALAIQDSSNLTVIYYLGLAQFAQENYDLAVPYLNQISEAIYLQTERAQWYLTLAYLHQGEVSEFKKAISNIVGDKEHSFFAVGMELMEEVGTQDLNK